VLRLATVAVIVTVGVRGLLAQEVVPVLLSIGIILALLIYELRSV
jgi:hypothetical protein